MKKGISVPINAHQTEQKGAWLKSFKGFENLTDEEAEEKTRDIVAIAEILLLAGEQCTRNQQSNTIHFNHNKNQSAA